MDATDYTLLPNNAQIIFSKSGKLSVSSELDSILKRQLVEYRSDPSATYHAS
jgi:hypothetical protein